MNERLSESDKTDIGLRLGALIVVMAIVAAGYAFHGRLTPPSSSGEGPRQQEGLQRSDLPDGSLTVVAEGLEVPWALAFLPDGSLLTERPGRLLRLDRGERRSYDVSGVRHVGEGGLMGLALHPDFESNRLIYVCLTAEGSDGLENRVERYRFDGGLADRTVIIDGIPGARNHDGCRLGFGPDDGLLYITTGDAGRSDAAQDRASLAGKILRLTPEGGVPEDNPFGTAVYSYGHRNPQGLTWDDRGRLWSTEHGPSGGRSGFDELNLIEPGKNYGWPRVEGDGSAPGMERPVLHAGRNTWAPGGAAYWNGRVFFGGLRGESLYEARIPESGAATLRRHFRGEFGRIRAVRMGPDGMLYFTTSNRDGRGRTRSGDDKILRLDPAVFD